MRIMQWLTLRLSGDLGSVKHAHRVRSGWEYNGAIPSTPSHECFVVGRAESAQISNGCLSNAFGTFSTDSECRIVLTNKFTTGDTTRWRNAGGTAGPEKSVFWNVCMGGSFEFCELRFDVVTKSLCVVSQNT